MRVPRIVALQAKKKVSGDRVPLVCEWNERLPNLDGLIQQFLPVLQSNENLSTCFSAPPSLSYRRPRNLRDLLVHTTCKNTDHRVHSAAGSYKCEHARCMTCATIVNPTRIELKSESRPIHGHFTCETRALVYLITCSSCNAVYVDETGQKLRERLNGHRVDIRNGNDTPVGVHFCQPGHELRVSGLELTSKNATSRKVRERSWIDFFLSNQRFILAGTVMMELIFSHCNLVHSFISLEPGPTWLLIVLGRQERAWGPVKIDHYSSPLLGRKVTNNAARKF